MIAVRSLGLCADNSLVSPIPLALRMILPLLLILRLGDGGRAAVARAADLDARGKNQIREKLNESALIAFDAMAIHHRQGPMRCRFAVVPRFAVALR